LPDELYLLGPFVRALREAGLSIGLFFENRAKNYCYVPRQFRPQAMAMFPDAVFVNETSAGDTPSQQLSFAMASNGFANPENSGRLLVTFNGIESCMGCPLRLVGGQDDTASAEWLEERLAAMVEI
jgi:hypothetical protein